MATPGTSIPNFWRAKNVKALIKTHEKVLKTLNIVYTMLLVQGRILQKSMAFDEPIGCVRFARNCGKNVQPPSFPCGRF